MAMRKWMTAAAGSWLVCAIGATGAQAACEPIFPGLHLGLTGDIVAADLDGDGDEDFASPGHQCVDVVFNEGNYRFREVEVPTDLGGSSIACGDVDGDGDIDLVVGHRFDEVYAVSVLLNDGLGGFLTAAIHVDDGYGWQVELGDVTGDGAPDIVTSSGEDELRVLINQGDGSFVDGDRFPALMRPLDLVIEDFNGDGEKDVGVIFSKLVNGLHNARIYPNRGGGSFDQHIELNCDGEHLLSMVGFDADCDGDVDIALSSWSSGALVFENQGQGIFGDAAVYASDVGWSALSVGDLNGDGYTDLLESNGDHDWSEGGLTLHVNAGDGTFGTKTKISVFGTSHRAILSDIDNDGDLDPIVPLRRGHYRNSQILLNSGVGEFAPQVVYHIADDDPRCIAAVDLNGDSYPDLVDASHPTGTVTVWLNDGSGRLTVARSFDTPITAASAIETRDMDGDGIVDLLLVCDGRLDWAGVATLICDGQGNLTVMDAYEIGDYQYDISVGDLNDDGLPDVVADSWDGELHLIRNEGDGTFSSESVLAFDCHSTRIADLDDDGREDLATLSWGYQSGVAVMRRVGAFVFAAPVFFDGNNGNATLVLEDVDLDGDIDAVITGWSSNDAPAVVETMLNKGDGSLEGPLTTEVRQQVENPLLVDLNGDNYLDLVGKDDRYRLSLHMGRGVGVFDEGLYFETINFASMAAADFDGDGLTDLAVKEWDDTMWEESLLVILFNQHRLPCPGDLNNDCDANQRDLGLLLKSFERDAAGDLDGDGDTDTADLGILLDNYGCN